jgi:hypothetical protein
MITTETRKPGKKSPQIWLLFKFPQILNDEIFGPVLGKPGTKTFFGIEYWHSC